MVDGQPGPACGANVLVSAREDTIEVANHALPAGSSRSNYPIEGTDAP
jgi:hypothetical protein